MNTLTTLESAANLPIVFTESLELARDFAKAARSVATQRAYRGDMAIFVEWCRSRGLIPLPASAEVVSAFPCRPGSARQASFDGRPPPGRHPVFPRLHDARQSQSLRCAVARVFHAARTGDSRRASFDRTAVCSGVGRLERKRSHRLTARPKNDYNLVRPGRATPRSQNQPKGGNDRSFVGEALCKAILTATGITRVTS